jgi:cytochrome c oxidase cbb3-type subunit 3
MDATAFGILASVILIELVAIAFILFSIRRIQTELLPQKESAKKIALEEWWSRLDKKLFTKAVAVEKEADILLDHDYDGIKELDNALPPWWKYGFIITIVVAFIYLINFHVLGYGKNPTEEYQQELADAQQAKEVYEMKSSNSADKVDESNLTMPDATGIAGGKDIFMSVCWTCHGKMGEGGAGPNLTDEYWIHKGSLTDIYLSIKHGYPEKGMQGWEKNYSPKEMNNLAGFIKTLKGTNPPNPKAAQGDIFIETGSVDTLAAKPIIAKDSAVINAGNIIKK